MDPLLKRLIHFRAYWCRVSLRLFLISLITLALALGWSPIALSQLPLSEPSGSSAQPPAARPPTGVQRLGAIEVAPVRFEGEELFRIASPTVRDRTNPGNQIPVEVRAERIQANLNRIVQTGAAISERKIESEIAYDPATLQVYVTTLNRQTVIAAKDNRHPEPLQIMTVTASDADYYGAPVEQVAQSFQAILGSRLRQALVARSPEEVTAQAEKAISLALGIIGASLGLWLLQKFLRIRAKILKARAAAEVAESLPEPDTPIDEAAVASQQTVLRQHVHRRSLLHQRRRLVGFLRWLTTWGQVVIWFGGSVWLLSLFPWTKSLSVQLLRVPIKLLTVWFAIGLCNRFGDTLLDRFARFWDEHDLFVFNEDDRRRQSVRIATAVGVMRGLKTGLIYLIGFTYVLSSLGLPISSVLALGGIVAFAISLGFQNVIKDVVTGCLLLWEDHYAIGDVIEISTTSGLAAASGFVENMTLRITQLRDSQGQLITVPNSSITQVKNMTRSWSRVDFAIQVAYDMDVDRALAVLQEVCQQIYAEPKWHDLIVEPPEVLGVDDISHTGILIRVWIKTQPAQQWQVGREFRRRVRVAFTQEGIAIGKPQQDFWYKNPFSNGGQPQLDEDITGEGNPVKGQVKDGQASQNTGGRGGRGG